MLPKILPRLTDPHSSQFELSVDGERHLASYWTLFTKPRFRAGSWTVILIEPRSQILAPVAGFRTVFPFAVLATLWVVLLLSIRAIKHRMAPLEVLKSAAQEMADERFDCRVDVHSGDEFEDLADTFNNMAERLDQQFSAMATRGEIDRAILSSLDAQTIARTLVTRASDLFECDIAMLAVFNREKPTDARLVTRGHESEHGVSESEVRFSPLDIEQLRNHPEHVRLGAEGNPVPKALVDAVGNLEAAIALPVFLGERLAAVMAFAGASCSDFPPSQAAAARQMADQLGVALSNSALVDELQRLNLETIEAFARAVDAKSPWTAGHSERVTVLSLGIGRELGLDPYELDCLHRGALLHDVGKLGVSARILDKPAKLDEEETTRIRAHPEIGVRILEPISAFREILSMVGQHHERVDGSGYPSGLSGDGIDLKARILSVADVYDAMTSRRPYRDGVSEDRVIKFIVEGAGRQYDFDVVQAFLRIIGEAQSENPAELESNIAFIGPSPKGGVPS